MDGFHRMDRSDEKLIAQALEGSRRESGSAVIPVPRSVSLKPLTDVVIGIVVVLLIWMLVAGIYNHAGSSALSFPTPLEVTKRLMEYLSGSRSLYGHSVYEHAGASIGRMLTAFAFSMVFGITVGSLIGSSSKVYSAGLVPVSIFQMIPGLAWLPVAILLFGLGDQAAIFIIFAVSSMVITLGVASAVRMVPQILERAARMSGAGRIRVFFQVLIPYAAPSIISALRIGVSSAWRVLIAAEMIVGTGLGLGYSIQLTRDLLDYVGSFACIVIICVVGLVFDRLILARIERAVHDRLGVNGY